MFAENENSTVYTLISKTKMKIFMSILMGIVLSTQRFNASCLLEPKKKTNKKKRLHKILRNQNCVYDLENCKICKIRDYELEQFIEIAQLKNMNSK